MPSFLPDMLIFADEREYTVPFRDGGEFEEQNNDVFLSKTNGTLEIALQEGVSFSITLSGDVMEFSVDISETLKGLTTGLMGIYNGDVTDDFNFPNGTILDINASDSQIYEYVKTWAVTTSNTIFTYENGLGPANFSDPSFVPIFLDEVPEATKQQAAAVCGGLEDSACVFDFVATGNAQLAERTQAAKQEFDTESILEASSAPDVNVTSVANGDPVNVIYGATETVMFDVTQADNLTFNVTFQTASSQYRIVNNDGSTVSVEYIPQSDEALITPPTLVVTNERDLTTLAPVAIVQCSNCSQRGQCDFANVREVKSDYVSIASCVCDSPYSGVNCENDKDGCEGFPCPLLTTCTDVPAEEEIRTNVSFTCSACPAGFTADSGRCKDVNECLVSTTCPKNSLCTNTIGSYMCTCNAGFRKDSSGNCNDVDECIELRHSCEQICVNQEGTYSCACQGGFDLDILGFNCTKSVTEPCAAFSSANCTYGCEVVNGTAQCFCENGFKLAPDGRTCIDVDECEFKLCAQTCINSVGSYSCQCRPGFKSDLDDMHEC
ncbi:hypothetical protein EGW08_005984, partial [Elysia chlorotica]